MPTPEPSPTIKELEKYVGMNHALVSQYPGRTSNELSCPGCSATIPQEHAQMSHCPCGTTTAVFGNSLYHWPTEIRVPAPEQLPFPHSTEGKPPRRPMQYTAVPAART